MHCTKCNKEIKNAGAHSRWCAHIKNLTRICKICGKIFEHEDRRKKLCSEECKHKSIVKTFSRDEIRAQLSNKRKDYLKNNPDKHPWKRKSKHDSEPCQNLKNALTDRSILFESEFTPLEERFFSIDIAFPALKLGIEVNGEQHYNRDGSLKSYYQERHDLITATGWKLYEIHYSICYNKKRLDDILDKLITEFDLLNADLTFVIKKKEKPALKYGSWKAAGEAQRLKTNEEYMKILHLWKQAIDETDITKFGFVGIIAKKMDCSHTHVRRVLNKYFPDIQFFKRKSSRESC
jgi:hypothetical protein